MDLHGGEVRRMILENTARKLRETDCEQMCEKTYADRCFDFASDDWFLPEYASKKDRLAVKNIHIGFSNINPPAVKLLVKQYVAWRLGHVKPVTVRMELESRLHWWVRYLEDKKIADPACFDARHMRFLQRWLQKKGLRAESSRRIVRTVAQLIETGQRLGWQVTGESVRVHVDRVQAIDGKSGQGSAGMLKMWQDEAGEGPAGEQNRLGDTKPIPEEVYRQILVHAIYDEKDIITKAGILIQSQTGLRISEVLSLKEHCLLADGSGDFLLGYESKKTQRAEPVMCFIPANKIVRDAVEELSEATKLLREESGRKELFLVKNHGIRPASASNWNRGRLRSFLQRWGITAGDGSEYPLHSHQFRATYVRQRLLEGTGIETVRRQFGHASSEMTAQYVHISPDELAGFLAPYIGMRGGCSIG